MSFQNWHKEFDKFWPEHSKVSKIFTLMGSFWAKYVLFELKKYREVIFHDIEEWCKIWRKTDLLLGKLHEEFCNFSPEHSKCQNWNFDKILFSKVENLWALNLQWSYVSWQWGMIQKLKRNWLVILKLTWISQNLTRALQKSNFFFNWLLVTKVYFFWATNVQRSYLSWHWGVMTSGLKKDMRNSANFRQSTWKCQNWNFDGFLLSKVKKV